MPYPITEITEQQLQNLLASTPELHHTLIGWIETATGKPFHYLNPLTDPSVDPVNHRNFDDHTEIDIRDIISGLANECRFHGQLRWNQRINPSQSVLNVAGRPHQLFVSEHTLFVWSVGLKYFDPQESNHDLMLGLLLHDAHEAYLKDFSPILRNILKAMSINFDFYDLLRDHVQERILERFEVSLSEEEERVIKTCDRLAFLIESDRYMASRGINWKPNLDFLASDEYEIFQADLPRELFYNRPIDSSNLPVDCTKLFNGLFFHYGSIETPFDRQYWLLRAFDRYGVRPEQEVGCKS